MTSYETRRKQFIEQLATVRNDSLKAQKQFLADLQGSHSGYAHLMSPDDVNWIAPLALESFLPAVDVLLDCMQKKMCFYDETFFDEDLKENVVIERADCYFEETTFAPDEELKKEGVTHVVVFKTISFSDRATIDWAGDGIPRTLVFNSLSDVNIRKGTVLYENQMK